jgi:hypothetical protein
MVRISLKGMAAVVVAVAAVAGTARPSAAPAGQEAAKAAQPLDYEVFKTRVQPVFLKDRPGHARCYSCHGTGNGPQYLVPLSPGSTTWTEEQTRQNFEKVSTMVVNHGDPANSKLLLRPLSPLAGGDLVWEHSGGHQFASKADPDWQAFAAWVGAAPAH